MSREHHHHLTGVHLRTAFFLTLIILVVEFAVGVRANSLALLSDAGHILTDAFALGLAWFATRVSNRPPNARNTFGYRRSSILAALVNAAALLFIGAVIVFEAVIRIGHPQSVNGTLLLPAAAIAIAVNAYIALDLRGEQRHNLNVRAAFIHVLGDLAASVGVVIAGVVILLWHATVVDPLLSIVIALLIAYSAFGIVRDTLGILMEATPRGVDLDQVRAAMREVPGVEDVHDLHVWALSDGFRLLTAHAAVTEQSLSDTATLVSDLKLLLHRRFHIEHTTIELECVDCRVTQRRPIQLHPPAVRDDSPGSRPASWR